MNEADRVRLRHMLDAAREALAFAQDRTLDDVRNDRMLALSLVKELEIIGEAAGRVSEDVKAMAPEVPWPVLVGMRNRLIHAYFDIDAEIVWITVTTGLPELVDHLTRLVRPS